MRAAFVIVVLAALAGKAAAATCEVPQPQGILWVPSPNFSNQSPGTVLDAIVLHTVEGSYQGAISWFQNPNSGVSAHFVISPQGEITQMVALDKKAWHATYYNSRSIGIECAGYANNPATWTPELLDALAALVAWLCDEYNILVYHPEGNAYDYPNNQMDEPGIVAHAQVQPWNKSDPGPWFPWAQFMADVQARIDAAYASCSGSGGDSGSGGAVSSASSGGNTRGGRGGRTAVGCWASEAVPVDRRWVVALWAAVLGAALLGRRARRGRASLSG